MALRNGAFTLTKEHVFGAGITAQDISDYAGIPVLLLCSSDFPSAEYMPERRAALARYLRKHNFHGAGYDMDALALNQEFVVYTEPEFIKLSQLRREIGDNKGNSIFSSYRFMDRGVGRLVMVPDLCRRHVELKRGAGVFVASALVMVGFDDQDPRSVWAAQTLLDAKKITRVPETRQQKLCAFLHEMRHTIQMSALSGGRGQLLLSYCAEMDAEKFSADVLRAQLPKLGENPQEALQSNTLSLWASLLVSDAAHCVVPALDALEKGLPLPKFVRVVRTVQSIQEKIIEKEKEALQADERGSVYDKYMNMMMCTPEIGYALLRRCLNDNAFAEDALAESIVKNVLDSVEFFCEGATRTPEIINRIYPVKTLEACPS